MASVEIEEVVVTAEEWRATVIFHERAPSMIEDVLHMDTRRALNLFNSLERMASPDSEAKPPEKKPTPPRDLKELVEPERWPVCVVDEVSYAGGAARMRIRVPLATFRAASNYHATDALGERADKRALASLLDGVVRALRETEYEAQRARESVR